MIGLILLVLSLLGPLEAYPYRLDGPTPRHRGYGVNVYGRDCLAGVFIDDDFRGFGSVWYGKSRWGINWK